MVIEIIIEWELTFFENYKWRPDLFVEYLIIDYTKYDEKIFVVLRVWSTSAEYIYAFGLSVGGAMCANLLQQKANCLNFASSETQPAPQGCDRSGIGQPDE